MRPAKLVKETPSSIAHTVTHKLFIPVIKNSDWNIQHESKNFKLDLVLDFKFSDEAFCHYN